MKLSPDRNSFIWTGTVSFWTNMSTPSLTLINEPSLRSQNYHSLYDKNSHDEKQDRRISPTSGQSGHPRIATLSNRPSTSGFSNEQTQTMTQTIQRVSMTCTTPPDQRSHNPGPSHNQSVPAHHQPGPSGRGGGNGRLANIMNHHLINQPGPGLSGQNMNHYNQNVFSQQCPPLVNSLRQLSFKMVKIVRLSKGELGSSTI